MVFNNVWFRNKITYITDFVVEIFDLKYSFVNFTTVPERRNTAIKFGIAIKPLQVSEIPQINPRSATAPMIATKE